jgi:hypothetical protein
MEENSTYFTPFVGQKTVAEIYLKAFGQNYKAKKANDKNAIPVVKTGNNHARNAIPVVKTGNNHTRNAIISILNETGKMLKEEPSDKDTADAKTSINSMLLTKKEELLTPTILSKYRDIFKQNYTKSTQGGYKSSRKTRKHRKSKSKTRKH